MSHENDTGAETGAVDVLPSTQLEDQDRRADPPPAPRPWKHFVRRLSQVLFFGGMGVIVIRLLVFQPVALEIDYDYGAALQGLQQVKLRYLQGAEEVRRASFQYDVSEVLRIQRHKVQLLKGDYEVIVDLIYEQQLPPEISGRQIDQRDGRPAVRLKRPLLVRNSGQVTIHLF